MKRACVLLCVGLLLAVPESATTAKPLRPAPNAKAAVQDTLGTLLNRGNGSAKVRVRSCHRERRAGWHRCIAFVHGTDHCKLIVHVRVRRLEGGETDYRAWGENVRCR